MKENDVLERLIDWLLGKPKYKERAENYLPPCPAPPRYPRPGSKKTVRGTTWTPLNRKTSSDGSSYFGVGPYYESFDAGRRFDSGPGDTGPGITDTGTNYDTGSPTSCD